MMLGPDDWQLTLAKSPGKGGGRRGYNSVSASLLVPENTASAPVPLNSRKKRATPWLNAGQIIDV